ncbi:MAG: hypothetical protein EOO46_21500, partial [Flavobacterium sp.]
MAWTPMYLEREDVKTLNDWLNQEEEIAFLISNGHKSWIAKHQHQILSDFDDSNYCLVEYNLWHIPSGPLPFLQDFGEAKEITDPFRGWIEGRTGANSKVPYFGAGHPGIISLQVRTSKSHEIPLSNFGWIGNHYRIIGNGAQDSTEKFWKKLKGTIKKMSEQIPRCNYELGKKEIFA